jgi:Protein of unknown function (DUF2510)
MTDQGTRREGWYADPLGQADLRWWDSQSWTTQVTASRSKDSRPTAEPRPAPLQWAEDELPANERAEDTNRSAPPTKQPSTEPKLALGAKPESTKGEPEPTAQGGPDWSPLTVALLAAGDNIVTASAATIPTIVIDMAERTYWWDQPLDSFPSYPVDLIVHSIPRADALKPTVAGRYIEPLLWRVGTGAQELFTRVDPALRYKLRRWPDLTAMPHTVDQLRAIKLLATAQLTTTELAAIADITEKDVRTLIGTFGLMSLLDAVRDSAASR